jgi:lipoprotein-releasing system ATP-binding protein
MTEKNDVLVRVEGISKSYPMGRDKLQVLRGVDLTVRRGEFVAVMGASGSGKSTLLHILGLLDSPDEGRISIDGRDVFRLSARRQDRLRNEQTGFVFQFYHLLPELNVLENVLLPEMVASSVLGWFFRRGQARRRAEELLGRLNLSGQTRQRPATLSGGERQRVALARALVRKPTLLLADEPTGNLDSANGKVILDLLTGLNNSGQTIIMVTHDVAVAERAHRTVLLRDGRLKVDK